MSMPSSSGLQAHQHAKNTIQSGQYIKKKKKAFSTIHEFVVALLEHKYVHTYIRSADANISVNGYHSKQPNAGHPKEYIQGSIDLQERCQQISFAICMNGCTKIDQLSEKCMSKKGTLLQLLLMIMYNNQQYNYSLQS